MRSRLKQMTLKGFKTVLDLQDFEPGVLTVLIGPNGAGKSNLISFFQMLSWTLTPPGGLQKYVGQQGGASQLLHDGPAVTREIEVDMTIVTDAGENQYQFRLVYAADDTLIYTLEQFRFSHKNFSSKANWNNLGAGHRESKLISHAEYSNDKTAKTVLSLLRRIIVYQFHNTSATARMRGKWDADDDRWLKGDAGNIAPFLFRLKSTEPKCYSRIVDTIRLALPFFADFELDPDSGRLLLKWRERNSDRVFSASQAADGMLRVMALVTLLLQPESDLPDVLILDEPELGLHPYAIHLVGGLIRSISTKTQVFVATQSTVLIDCFEPQDIVVVNRTERESKFDRLNETALAEWRQDYSLSELWEKNVIGGRPQ